MPAEIWPPRWFMSFDDARWTCSNSPRFMNRSSHGHITPAVSDISRGAADGRQVDERVSPPHPH